MKKITPLLLEICLLLFLILIAGITLLILDNTEEKGSLPEQILPDWNNLTLIRIEKPETTQGERIIELERENKRWVIQPLNRYAGEEELSFLKTQLSSLQAVDIIAEKGPYDRFGLIENQLTKLVLKTEVGRKVLLVGSATASGNYTYVRFENDPAVYTVRGKLHDLLQQKTSSYRDRKVLSFNPDEIKSLILSKGEESRVLFRNSDEWWDSNGMIPESAELNTYVKRLSQLKCLSFLKEEESLELKSQKDPLLSLSLKSEDTSWNLKILKQHEGSYTAGTIELEDAFSLSRYDGDFLKKLSGF